MPDHPESQLCIRIHPLRRSRSLTLRSMIRSTKLGEVIVRFEPLFEILSRDRQRALIPIFMRSMHLRICAPAAIFLVPQAGAGSAQDTTLNSLEQAIDLAPAHNHSIHARRTLILRNRAASDTVLSDVANANEAMRSNEEARNLP